MGECSNRWAGGYNVTDANGDGQIKYFKEKRVMEWKRDQTIAKIQEEDAVAAAKAKAKRGGGWFS